MNINYTLTFHTDWHCGSGLSAGADVDALVVKDNEGLPFVPGKTIKGLVREAAQSLRDLANLSFNAEQETAWNDTFGQENAGDGTPTRISTTFFTNAEMKAEERTAIAAENLTAHLYRNISRTAIDDKGIAKEHSLRRMEVTIPCELHGEILHVPDEMVEHLKTALAYIKRMGLGRHRGLGRCTFQTI